MKLFSPSDRVIAVVAHPDDAELMFYGTLRRAKDAGATVRVLMASRGERGVAIVDEATYPGGLAGRVAEAQAAVFDSGFEVQFLDLPDGRLAHEASLVSEIERVLLGYQPTIVLTHWPYGWNDHQDHLAVGRAAVNCGMRAAIPIDILCGEPVQAGSGFTASIEVDVSRYIADKSAALGKHTSQLGRWYLSEAATIGRAQSWNGYPQLAVTGILVERFSLVHSFVPLDS